MKSIILASVLIASSFVAAPGSAQSKAPATAAAESDETISKERLRLAEEMHDIWPIRTRLESAIDTVSQGFPPERQAEVKATMRKSIKFDELEEASIKAMAETYTDEELKAMIAFYGSEVGRSISAKTGDYENGIRPVISKMMDKAMMDLRVGQQ